VGLVVWLLAFALLARTAMTLVYVPLMALGAELTDDAVERMSLVAWRYAFGLFGQGCLVIAGFTLFFAPSPEYPDGQLDPAAYPRLAAVMAVVILAVVLGSAAGTHHRIRFLPPPGRKSPPTACGLGAWWNDLRHAMTNRSFRAVFLASSSYSVSRGVQLALGVHLLTYFWQLPPGQIQVAVVARLLGVALGLPLGRAAGRRLEKRVLMASGIWWFFAVGTLPVGLRLLDWFPANSDPWTLRLVVLCNVIAGLGGGVALVANGSMLADISDEHELEHGVRREGVFFGAEALAEKASSGIGLLVAGIAIDVIRFPSEAASNGVPPEAVARLGLVYGPVLLLSAGLSTLFLRRYRLDRRRHHGILRRLAVARASTGAPAIESATLPPG
jgi:Na+/melibiose symporter-like transporter